MTYGRWASPTVGDRVVQQATLHYGTKDSYEDRRRPGEWRSPSPTAGLETICTYSENVMSAKRVDVRSSCPS
jgi:hypothetical protein